MPFGPPRYEVRHLEALRTVAEEGTFRGAADVLGYSQAAISQQIGALEASVGSPVFDRPGGPRAVTLTPVGRALLRHAEVVLDRLDQARQEVEGVISGTGGRLVVGTFQSVSVELLPYIVGRVRGESPNLQMRAVEENENEPLLQRMHDGELDVAFLAGPVSDPAFEIIALGTDPIVALVPNTPDFSGLTALPLRDAALMGLIGEHHNTAQGTIEDAIRSEGATPRYVFRTNDNGAMQAMVRNRMGAAIMPLLAVQANDPGVRVLPTEPAIPPRSIVLALPRAPLRSAAAERFAEIAREVCAVRLSQPG